MVVASTPTCSACGRTWLVAQEERHNDLFILRRLDPETTERLRFVAGSGRRTSIGTRLCWRSGGRPGTRSGSSMWGTPPLLHTIASSSKERPGIRVLEMSTSLLNLDLDNRRRSRLGRSCSGRRRAVSTADLGRCQSASSRGLWRVTFDAE